MRRVKGRVQDEQPYVVAFFVSRAVPLRGRGRVILILADSTDPWGVALARQLTLRGESYVLQEPGQMRASTIDRTVEWVQRLTGVYRGASRLLSGDASNLQFSSADVTASEWLTALNTLPCPVVNRLSPGGVLSCPTGSPAWEAVVSAHGFQVPCFYEALNRDETLACLDRWGGAAYVKPVGVLHSGLALSVEAATAYAGDLAPERPVLLAQARPGQLVSLYVVGDKVAATVVRSMRGGEASMSPACLGPSLLQQCSDLVLALGLVHAECVLSLSSDGQIACLDVVASPNYWTCPREAQRQVVSGLACYLAEGTRGFSLIPAVTAAEAIPAGEYVGAGIPEKQ